MVNVELENDLIEFKARLEFRQDEILRLVHEINLLHISEVVLALATADLLHESVAELEQIFERHK